MTHENRRCSRAMNADAVTLKNLDYLHGNGRIEGVSEEKNCYICGKLKSEKGEGWCSYPHARMPVAPVDPEHPEGFWIWEKINEPLQ